MLFPEYFQELLGWCPSRGLGLLPPPPHPSQPRPAPLAGNPSLCLRITWQGKKEVQLMISAQFPGDPGLDGQSCVY